MRMAQKVASELNGDGQQFENEEGRTLHDLATDAGASVEYGRRDWDYDAHGERRDVPCEERPVINVRSRDIWDLVRYGFADGSAIVVAGGAWDFEGE